MDKIKDYVTQIISQYSSGQLADIFRVIEHKKGFSFGPHIHEEIEINYVKRGTCIMRFDTGAVRFYENDCMVLYPNNEHYFEVDRTNCILVQIQFNLNNFPELQLDAEADEKMTFLSDVISNKRRYVKIVDKKKIRFAIERIISEQQERKDNYEIMARIYFSELFILLSREIYDLIQGSRITNNKYLSSALEIINSRYADNINIEIIAKETGITSRYLRKIFNDYTGISPIEYINSLRIKKAKELMKDISLSLKEIGYATGFSNQPYFSKKFKIETGLSPNEYRLENHKSAI